MMSNSRGSGGCISLFQAMLSSRRGFFFLAGLFLVVVGSMTYALIEIAAKQSVPDAVGPIGKQPIAVVTQVQEGEKALMFVDSASKFSLYQAVYDLQASGGLTDTGRCGTYYGFNMWNTPEGETCFVDSQSAKRAMRDLFTVNMVARTSAYPTADFIGNLPLAAFARGRQMAAGNIPGIRVYESPERSEEGSEGETDEESEGSDEDGEEGEENEGSEEEQDEEESEEADEES